jgi:DNA-directed RNA polymerase subunit K/omega
MSKIASVEQYNIDNCDAAFDGNRFQLILAAGVRAHEISKARVFASRQAGATGVQVRHSNLAVVSALLEVDAGMFGKEYLDKVGNAAKPNK